MSIMFQRAVFLVGTGLGAVWNCLCLFGVLSLSWLFSLVPVCLGSLFVLLPLLFPALSRKREKSAHMTELEMEEKVLAVASLAFLVTWVLTAAACVVNLP